MRRPKNRLVPCIIVLAAALATAGCSRLPVYSHYEHVDSDGWRTADTLRFVTAVADSATYGVTLGLRVDRAYPYTQIAIATRCTDAAQRTRTADTLVVSITDDDGNFIGAGTSLFQYDVAMQPVTLPAGDTLRISVSHVMTAQTLPGVTDVGITVQKYR